jgi:hypothetical protein
MARWVLRVNANTNKPKNINAITIFEAILLKFSASLSVNQGLIEEIRLFETNFYARKLRNGERQHR